LGATHRSIGPNQRTLTNHQRVGAPHLYIHSHLLIDELLTVVHAARAEHFSHKYMGSRLHVDHHL
jgi:hypothetical protein